MWAGVHPTNLTSAILVWNTPVTIIDRSKITPSNSIGVNGRIMTVELDYPVFIDGTTAATVQFVDGAVGAYVGVTDDNVSTVNTFPKMAPATKNDCAAGNDQTSQTISNGYIPGFVDYGSSQVLVQCTHPFEMQPALQPDGTPHKIWGACYCIWGSTHPMGQFPYGQSVVIDPSSMLPTGSYYTGTVGSYADRGEAVSVHITGVAGLSVTLQSYNDTELPLQAGQLVAFDAYGNATVCGHADQTKITIKDPALAYVDEDIIKPTVRTMTAFGFTPTTYYLTTLLPVTATDLIAYTTNAFPTTLLQSVWRGVSDAGEAMGSAPVRLFEGVTTEITTVKVKDENSWMIPTALIGVHLPLLDVSPAKTPVVTEFSTQVVPYLPGGTPVTTDYAVNPSLVEFQAFPTVASVAGLQLPLDDKATITKIKLEDKSLLLMPEGSKALADPQPDPYTLVADTMEVATGGDVVTGGTSTTLGVVDLVVCDGSGSRLTLKVLTASGSVTVYTSLTVAPLATDTLQYIKASDNVTVVTQVSSADPVTQTYAIPTADGTLDVVTSINTVAAETKTAITATGVNALLLSDYTDVAAALKTASYYLPVDFDKLTCIDGYTQPNLKLITGSDVSTVLHITTSYSPAAVSVKQYSQLVDVKHFAAASEEAITLLTPIPGESFHVAVHDTAATPIKVLAETGSDEVSMLLPTTAGAAIKLVGKTESLSAWTPNRTPKGPCASGDTAVSATSSPYESDDECLLLAPLIVAKDKGNAEECPCFTAKDTSGSESVTHPTDNSVVGSFNPCTIRVRRLQLRECHK
jgi:hypothetical protein